MGNGVVQWLTSEIARFGVTLWIVFREGMRFHDLEYQLTNMEGLTVESLLDKVDANEELKLENTCLKEENESLKKKNKKLEEENKRFKKCYMPK